MNVFVLSPSTIVKRDFEIKQFFWMKKTQNLDFLMGDFFMHLHGFLSAPFTLKIFKLSFNFFIKHLLILGCEIRRYLQL